MQISSPSGRNPGTKTSAAYDAFKQETRILERTASAGSRKQNSRKERSSSVCIVDVADALDKLCYFLSFLKSFFILLIRFLGIKIHT